MVNLINILRIAAYCCVLLYLLFFAEAFSAQKRGARGSTHLLQGLFFCQQLCDPCIGNFRGLLCLPEDSEMMDFLTILSVKIMI